VLETQLVKDNSAAQARISDLEAKLAAANVRSEGDSGSLEYPERGFLQ
jgi:hypothetical protein